MPVNVDNINATIARIRQNQNFSFNMSDWGDSTDQVDDANGHPCGTSACIAGFASLASGVVPTTQQTYYFYDDKSDTEIPMTVDVLDFDSIRDKKDDRIISAFEVGKEFLGINETQADSLFIPGRDSAKSSDGEYYIGPYWFGATAEEGIKVLEHLRDTGEVNWYKSGIVSKDGDKFYDAYKNDHGKTLEEYYENLAREEASAED